MEWKEKSFLIFFTFFKEVQDKKVFKKKNRKVNENEWR